MAKADAENAGSRGQRRPPRANSVDASAPPSSVVVRLVAAGTAAVNRAEDSPDAARAGDLRQDESIQVEINEQLTQHGDIASAPQAARTVAYSQTTSLLQSRKSAPGVSGSHQPLIASGGLPPVFCLLRSVFCLLRSGSSPIAILLLKPCLSPPSRRLLTIFAPGGCW
jgi:hypothetical protein